jgi:signal transduction histidine kinase
MTSRAVDLSEPGLLRRDTADRVPPPVAIAAAGPHFCEPEARHARQTAETVRGQLPWAVLVFLVTYAAVAPFEIQQHPQRMALYLGIYLIGVVWCVLALALTRAPAVSAARTLVVTTLLGVGLIANTTLYHIIVGGEAEVLALGNVYLMIGFLVAFPWGARPQFVVAATACIGVALGLLTTVHASVSSGILLSGMVSLAGLSVASALLTDRYRYTLFHAQEELQRAKDTAEAANRARGDFVATVSHDLRTPVNIIFGMADMALDVAVTTEQREFVETIRRTAGQLHALLNDLLDFSKIDAGTLDLAPRRFGVGAWLDAALQPHAAEAAAKGLRLLTEIDASLPDAVVADPDRLRQVLGNLVSNAVKFTDAGDVSVHVHGVPLDGAGRGLRVTVADTGVGIAPADAARLFEPFAQSAATRSRGGTGLGLAICKRLVERMGGDIAADSRLGHGSTFWFIVPYGDR